MSDGFDFPPASDSNMPIGSLTPRFDGLRQTFNRQTAREDREEQSTARDSGVPFTPAIQSRPMMRRSRQESMPTTARSRLRSQLSSATSPERLRHVAATAPRQPGQLRRIRQEMHEGDGEIGEELRERRHLLNRMSNHLDDTESRIFRDTASTPQRRRPIKRRKLVHDKAAEMRVPEPYGYYGQVEAGQLRMDIVSCDGGRYESRDPRSLLMENYRAGNVLRKDESVYCTKSSRCNMMLQQEGGTLFHLESLVIAAPKRGYTAPIQQGLIFVGMSAEDLTRGTQNYSIQYSDSLGTYSRSPTPQMPSAPTRSDERLSLLEAVNDDQIWQASRSRYEAYETPALLPLPSQLDPVMEGDVWRRWAQAQQQHELAAPRHISQLLREEEAGYRQRNVASNSNAFLDNCDWPPLHEGNSAPADSGLTRAPTPPSFTATAVMESSDDEAVASHRNRERDEQQTGPGPYGMLFSPSNELNSETETTDVDGASDSSFARRAFRLRNPRRPRPMRRSTPGEVVESAEDRDGSEGLMEPSAKFFMPESECRITVRFDPPVAGKFILLKLFSPQLRDGPNIDIEYIAAHGFSGPRFFPSVEMK